MGISSLSVILCFDAYLPVVKILPHILRHDHNKVIDVLVLVRRYTCKNTHARKLKGAQCKCHQSYSHILKLKKNKKTKGLIVGPGEIL